MFQKIGYPGNFIDKYFKKILNKNYLVKENVPTVKKNHLLPIRRNTYSKFMKTNYKESLLCYLF